MLLKTGVTAPDFTMEDHSGKTVTLSSFKGKNPVVLIFYPGDETPGCIKQLCEIRDSYTIFSEKGIMVFGVNPAGAKSHKKFVENYNFQFPLLIDEEEKTAKAYGCKGTLMLKRTVYVINTNGKIVFAKRGSPAVSEIIASLEE